MKRVNKVAKAQRPIVVILKFFSFFFGKNFYTKGVFIMSNNLMELSKLDMDPVDVRCIRWTNALENIAAGIVERREGNVIDSLGITVRCSLLIPDDSYPTLILSANKVEYVVEMG